MGMRPLVAEAESLTGHPRQALGHLEGMAVGKTRLQGLSAPTAGGRPRLAPKEI